MKKRWRISAYVEEVEDNNICRRGGVCEEEVEDISICRRGGG